jgi:hypothetical protein
MQERIKQPMHKATLIPMAGRPFKKLKIGRAEVSPMGEMVLKKLKHPFFLT